MKYKKSQIRSIFLIISTLLFSIILVYSFAGGDGSLGNPYQIENCTHLQNMSSNLNANYTLNNDINCGIPPYNTGPGFNPIGNCTTSCSWGGDDYPFTGNFNGSDYEIQNLYINRSSESFIGLFGAGNNSVISHVKLRNINIIGNNNIGGIVGGNNGPILNSSTTGTINGGNFIGGLVGNNLNNGRVNHSFSSVNIYGGSYIGGLFGGTSYAKIDNSYATGNVNGATSVGGFAGWFYYGTIENSYASGNVNGNSNVGGLVGYNKGLGTYIDNSYATGSVNGSNIVGGLVGLNFAFIDNSFSIGFVTGSSNTGGLVGSGGAGVTSSYWDNETSNQTTSAAGTGRSTADMFLQSTFSGWDNSLWIFTNTSYPQLAWAYVPAASPSFLSLFPAQSYISIIITSILLLGIFIFN